MELAGAIHCALIVSASAGEADALHIGQQFLPNSALERFPQLQNRLWKDKGSQQPPVK